MPDRQSLDNLLALLQLFARRELLVEHPAREGIDEPASGPGENRLVIDLDDANLIRFVARVEQRLGLVVVVGETVEDPPAHHAVVPPEPILHQRHHEIVGHRLGRVEVPLRLDAQLRGIVVRGVPEQGARVDVGHVQRLREPLRDGALARRGGADDGDARGHVPVDARGGIPPRAAVAPNRSHRDSRGGGQRDRLLEPRVPRAVGFVRQDVIVHSLGDRAGRSVLGALDNLVRGGEFGFGFGDSLRKSIRFLSDVSEVALVLPRVVRRVREEDEEGVESGGAHGGRPRGVGLEHGHLPLDAQSLNLGEGRPVRDGDWRIANVLVDPLAVTDDDLGALQELALLGLGVEGCLVDEPVVHAVNLPGLGLAGGGREREAKRVGKFFEQSLEDLLLPRPQRAGDDQGLGRRDDKLGMDPGDRGLEVAVREFRGVVERDDDVGEEPVGVAPRHLPRDFVQTLGNLLLLLVGELGWLVRELDLVLVAALGVAIGRGGVVFPLRRRRRRLLDLANPRLQPVDARGRDEAKRPPRVHLAQSRHALDVHDDDGDLVRVVRRLNRLDGRPEELAVDLGVFHKFAVGDVRLERRPVDVLVVHARLLALLGGARGFAADVREPVGELLVERAVDCLSTDARGAAEDDWYDWFALVGISRGENVGSLLDDDVLELLVRDIRIVEADRALPQPGIEPALLLSLRGD